MLDGNKYSNIEILRHKRMNFDLKKKVDVLKTSQDYTWTDRYNLPMINSFHVLLAKNMYKMVAICTIPPVVPQSVTLMTT